MMSVRPGSVFIREGAALPDGIQTTTLNGCGWLQAGDAGKVQELLEDSGWYFLQLAGKELAVTMFGMRPAEAIEKTISRALERVPAHRNAAEVRDLKMTNVGGVFFATIHLAPRHIQQAAFVDVLRPQAPAMMQPKPQVQMATA